MSELGGSVGRIGVNNARAGMHHSLSTPAGVDGGSRSPPATPQKGGKMLAVRIQMLDDSVTLFQIQSKALGKVLFEQVCRQLHLLEADYFGLEYQEPSGTKYWLDLEKPVCRQVGLSLVEPILRFCVKFYTPDPSQLEEEFTRYLFCLQIKRDLAQGVIQCNDNTAALMASYIVQAECGDYVSEDYPDHTYLSSYRFVPQQEATMERRIMENHKKHAGQSPAAADLNLLETARRCELYGMKMHSAKDHEGVPLNLAVAHMGIVVFQHTTKINTFSWAKIRKISFKRKKFLVKLHPEGYGYYKDTVEFFFEGRNECKNFWKKCVENHGFFRCSAVKRIPRHKTRVLSRGSSFRYSGKTQKQIVEFVRDNYMKRQTFQRSQSFRHSSNLLATHPPSASVSVNASVSAHPLLPLADPVESVSQVQHWGSMPAPVSLMTRVVCPLPSSRTVSTAPASPQGVTAAVVERPPHIQMTTSPSPPLTTRSGSPVTSATWSPPGEPLQSQQRALSPPAAVVQGHQRVDELTSIHSPCKPSDYDTDDDSVLSDNNNSYLATSTPLGHIEETETLLMSPLNGNVTFTETLKQKENITNLTEKVKTTYIVAEIDKSHKSRNDNVIEKSNGNFTKHNSIQADSDFKKKIREKWPTDRAYFIAKELLMTERTFKKDLDVITTWFREELSPEDEVHLSPLLSLCEHLGTHHIGFLRDLEQRLSLWEGRSSTGTNGVHISAHQHHRIGDVILKIMAVLPIYEDYLDSHLMVLQKLDNAFWSDSRFQQMYRDFEHQKVCYLPFTSFVLKPLQRLLHYQILLDQLLEHYPDDHFDRADCLGARALLARVCQPIRDTLQMSENYAQLCELQRDLNGFEGLVQEGRQLIRQGCLLKHSTRGLQQRMFFLLSDILLYASKPPSPCQTFKVHGHVPLRALMLENGDSPNSFVIFGGTRSITVSANTEDEKQKWMTDIIAAVQNAKEHGDSKANYLSLKSCSSSEEVMDSCGAGDCPTAPKTPAQRSNTALHVCWHRAATISMAEIILQMENQLSGYLLRKFKNSAGWQKLWVVFTSFCLYFYKVYQDESPLASLPLLGYAVSPPSEQDSINKDFVFKLTFKNHVYFFRAESEHTYARWMEVIGSATQSPKCT